MLLISFAVLAPRIRPWLATAFIAGVTFALTVDSAFGRSLLDHEERAHQNVSKRKQRSATESARVLRNSQPPQSEGRFSAETRASTTTPTAPAPNDSFTDLATNEVVNVLVRITQNQRGSKNQLRVEVQKTPSMNDSDYQMRVAAWKFDTDYSTRTNTNEIGHYVTKEAGKALTDIATERVGVWNKFKAGFDFDFNLGSLLGSGSEKRSGDAAAAGRPKVRYGLVLKEIRLPVRQNFRASVSRKDIDSELSDATRAQAVWTIAPITHTDVTSPFQASVPPPLVFSTPTQAEQQTGLLVHDDHRIEVVESPPETTGVRQWLKIPSMKFKGKFAPAKIPSNIPMDEAALNSGWRISLTQEESLYSVEVVTDKKFKADGMTHKLNVPLVGIASLTRTYDRDLKVTSTTLNNLLIFPNLPSVTVTRFDQTQKYKAGVNYSRGTHKVGLAAETPEKWEPSAIGTAEGEKYNLNYSFDF